ncbi:MAG TPA: outer membrane beta-barrel protein [Allosphingosinicella sp.]|jgi:outer membrane immunogenic protein|nr:outer membrane beta-barrel protein [Allosphingosinicella sp.]
MRSFAIVTFTAAAFIAATPAAAQENIARTDASPWQGFRIEGLAGYDSARIQSNNDGGFVYGVGVGYDFQTGRAVLGIEAEASDSTNSGCTRDLIVASDAFCARAQRELSIGLRAGILVSPRTLLYAKAGYTNARFSVDYDDGTPAGTNNFSYHENLDGIRVGGGAEFRVGGNAFVKLEGRYSNYQFGGDRGQGVAAFGFRF